jgi:ATP-binding cassette, subfamily B, bacterial IrtB/YbtQ
MIKTYQRMLRIMNQQAPQMRRNIRFSVIASILDGAIYGLLFPIFTLLLSPSPDRQNLILLVSLCLILLLIETWLRWQELTFSWVTTNDIAYATRLRLGEKLRQIPLELLSQRRSGELNVVLGGNVSEIVMWIGNLCMVMIQALLVPLTTAIVTAFYDWRLALIILILFPTTIPIYRQLRRLSGRSMRRIAQSDGETANRIIEYVQGLPVFRATRQVQRQANQLRQAIAQQRQVQVKSIQASLYPSLMLGSIVEIGLTLILAIGSFWILQGSLSVPVLFALLIVIIRFSFVLSHFASFASVFDLTEAGLERIEAILTMPALALNPSPLTPDKFNIQFTDVTFHYAEQSQPTLQHISLQCPARSLTALVGSSGSGKTTITRLIMRYADVSDGAVTIGGIDVRDMSPTTLASCLSVVFQDVYLFDDTIYNNIRLAKATATDAEIEAAAIAANCHDFITRFPDGYQTQVGEIGGALSGGERQRISIARAILKDASIVLLDEPTSALDAESEIAVQGAINQLVQNKTVIVIAHRLSTIVAADQIIVLEQGQIVESGRHHELLDRGGRYAKLWQAQQADQVW